MRKNWLYFFLTNNHLDQSRRSSCNLEPSFSPNFPKLVFFVVSTLYLHMRSQHAGSGNATQLALNRLKHQVLPHPDTPKPPIRTQADRSGWLASGHFRPVASGRVHGYGIRVMRLCWIASRRESWVGLEKGTELVSICKTAYSVRTVPGFVTVLTKWPMLMKWVQNVRLAISFLQQSA